MFAQKFISRFDRAGLSRGGSLRFGRLWLGGFLGAGLAGGAFGQLEWFKPTRL